MPVFSALLRFGAVQRQKAPAFAMVDHELFHAPLIAEDKKFQAGNFQA
jgi:hypothetical protein